MRENKKLEFKEKETNSFLKTVSAFANYGAGEIKFGITDTGNIVGIKDPVDTCLNIENKINDSIKPNPDYKLSIDSNNVITLFVDQGDNPPYFYKSKAYKRNDSSTIEVDPVELSRLILAGENRTFDSLNSSLQNLNFLVLEKELKKNIGIDKLTQDLLITLDLYRKNKGYTNAGAMLADTNDFSGVDIVRFGDNINIMLDHVRYDKVSLLTQYQNTLEKYRQYYQREEIQGSKRTTIAQIPEEAFREALANALVHRTWDVNAQIKVSMFNDRIEIVSPGGLPANLSEDEYLSGQISILRNPIIANVFFRLGLIEQFGTDVRRIKASYGKKMVKPQFYVFENSIKIVLPVLTFSTDGLSKDTKIIYDSVKKKMQSTAEIAKSADFGRTKTLYLINKLIEQGYLKKIGNGRTTKYLAN